jgi:hypothetical protein
LAGIAPSPSLTALRGGPHGYLGTKVFFTLLDSLHFAGKMESTYQSLPLDSTKGDIRLLKLSRRTSSTEGDGFSCSIIKATLSQSLEFNALSYVWGEPVFSERISIDGTPIFITKNLHQALERIQTIVDISPPVGEDFLLWTDAVCIDQSNTEEKNGQIPRMSEIFGLAKHVMAWLGPSSNDSDLVAHECHKEGRKLFFLGMAAALGEEAIENCQQNSTALAMLMDLAELMVENHSGLKILVLKLLFTKSGSQSQRLSRFTKLEWLDSMALASGMMRSAWLSFFDRDFWKRTWILQEMVLGKNVSLLCGSAIIKLEYLLAVWSVMVNITAQDQMSGKSILSFPRCSYIYSLFSVGKMMENILFFKLEPPNFIHAISQTNKLAATCHKDKIYGVLGISSDATELDIRVDYSKTFQEICVNIARQLLIRKGVEALSYSLNLPGPPRVPSWVTFYPIFKDTGRNISNFSERNVPKMDIPFSASRNTVQTFSKHSFPNAQALKVSGTIIDRVQNLAYPNNQTEHNSSGYRVGVNLENVRETIKIILNLAEDIGIRTDSEYGKSAPIWWVGVAHWDPHAVEASQKDRYISITEELHKEYKALRESPEPKNKGEALSQLRESSNYIERMLKRTFRHCFFNTSSRGFLGVGPLHLGQGDQIVILHGAKTPFALRALGNGSYRLLGEVYVLGIMHGEFMTGDPPVTEFILE